MFSLVIQAALARQKVAEEAMEELRMNLETARQAAAREGQERQVTLHILLIIVMKPLLGEPRPYGRLTRRPAAARGIQASFHVPLLIA